jgi:glycogen operon protein
MWFNTEGAEMTDEEWRDGFIRCLGMLLGGDAIDVRDARGEPIRDDTFLMLLNASHEQAPFVLPIKNHGCWELIVDTRLEAGFSSGAKTISSGEEWTLIDRSLCLFKLVKTP